MSWIKGLSFSKEHKLKISLAHKGIPKSLEHRKNLSLSIKGHLVSDETKQKISLGMTGKNKGRVLKPLSNEHKLKISLTNQGRKLSEEHKNKLKGRIVSNLTKQKLSLFNKGKHLSSETKQKLQLINLGKKRSYETRRKLSLAQKGRKYSLESRQKMSISAGGDGIHFYCTEDKHYPLEYSRIRPTILNRDNYICQNCFKFGKSVHHKDHNKNNNDPSNLITYCQSCNSKEIRLWNKRIEDGK